MRLHPITVDSREQIPPPAETVAAFSALGVPSVVGTLPAGDFRWVAEPEDTNDPWWVYVIERKSLKDLVASLDDGRLARFIDETGGVNPPPTQIRGLLVEGDLDSGLAAYRGRDWSAESLEAVLFDAQLLGLLIVRSPSPLSTPRRLANLWKWSGRDEHKALLRPTLPGVSDSYIDPEVKAAVRVLMTLPGWGETRARAAIAEKGSPQAVLKAIMNREFKEFDRVPGVGRGVVTSAAEFLEKQVSTL